MPEVYFSLFEELRGPIGISNINFNCCVNGDLCAIALSRYCTTQIRYVLYSNYYCFSLTVHADGLTGPLAWFHMLLLLPVIIWSFLSKRPLEYLWECKTVRKHQELDIIYDLHDCLVLTNLCVNVCHRWTNVTLPPWKWWNWFYSSVCQCISL